MRAIFRSKQLTDAAAGLHLHPHLPLNFHLLIHIHADADADDDAPAHALPCLAVLRQDGVLADGLHFPGISGQTRPTKAWLSSSLWLEAHLPSCSPTTPSRPCPPVSPPRLRQNQPNNSHFKLLCTGCKRLDEVAPAFLIMPLGEVYVGLLRGICPRHWHFESPALRNELSVSQTINQSRFVPIYLSLVEQRGQHGMYTAYPLSCTAGSGWAATGWPW